MKALQILRFGSVPEMGTFGQMTIWDDDHRGPLFTCRTVEREWMNNMPYKSCIPDGIYTMTLGMYYGGDGVGGKKDYPAYVVRDVPDRDLIKIHVANTASDLLGCIAPGLDYGTVSGEWAVIQSWKAFNPMMAFLAGDQDVGLEITWRVNGE